MPKFFALALALAAALAACQAPSSPVPGDRGGGRMGTSLGPMMAYGYCPGSGGDGAQSGWRGPGMMGAGRGGAEAGSSDAAATAAWLDDAKTQIGVTDAQEQAWTAYAAAVEADRAAMLQMHEQMPVTMAAGGSAADRLQTHLNLMSARLTSLQHIGDATEALYAVLTSEQRARADRILWSGCWR